MRIVFGRDELVEKIRLADDAHDDILIETVKFFHSIKNQIDITSPFYALEDCGLVERKEDARSRVHMLHPSKGYIVEEWVIEKEDEAAPFRDKVSGDLYAITFYEEGEAKTKLLLKEQWERARQLFDSV